MKKALILLMVVLAACNGNTIFRQFDNNLTDNRWLRHDVHTYDFEVTSNAAAKISLDLSYVADIALPSIPVKITLEGNGITSEKILQLNTSDTSGTALGDCDGDYCDMRFPAFERVAMKPGKYRVSLENEFGYGYIPNVIGIGICVEKIK